MSRSYSLGYLHHLYRAGESLAGTLVSEHNIEYLGNITRKSREAILSGKFMEWKEWYTKNTPV